MKKTKTIIIIVSALCVFALAIGILTNLLGNTSVSLTDKKDELPTVSEFGGETLYKKVGELIASDYVNSTTFYYFDGKNQGVFAAKLVNGSIVNNALDPSFVKLTDSSVSFASTSYITVEFTMSSIYKEPSCVTPVKMLDHQFNLSGFDANGENVPILENFFKVTASDDSRHYFDLYYGDELLLDTANNAKVTFVIRCEQNGTVNGKPYMRESDMLVFINDEYKFMIRDFNINNIQNLTNLYCNDFYAHHDGQSAFGYGRVITNVFEPGYEGAIEELFESASRGLTPDLLNNVDIKSYS